MASPPEAPSLQAVLRDGITALIIIVSAFVIEIAKHTLFEDGLPLIPRVLTVLMEVTLFLSFVPPFTRALRRSIAEVQLIGTLKTLQSLAAGFRFAGTLLTRWQFLSELGEAFKSALHAGLITGAVTGCLALILVAISWAPWWIKVGIFVIGLLVNLSAFVYIVLLAHRENKSGLQELGRSGGGEAVGFILIFLVGLTIWGLLFGGVAEAYLNVLSRLGSSLFG